MSKSNAIETPSSLRVTTRELALISMLSALWIAAQIILGPLIGQMTGVHGVIQRVIGWLLMVILAGLTRKFGRITMMATIVALGTRVIRYSASFYPWVLAMGYALGGLVFDISSFLPVMREKTQTVQKGYILLASLLSGIVTLCPYLIFQFYTLGFMVFVTQLPLFIYSMTKGVILSIIGTILGLSIVPQIREVFLKLN